MSFKIQDYCYVIFTLKNTSIGSEDNSLISVLQSHYKRELNLAKLKLISLFITALCKAKTINYDRPASAFDTKAGKIVLMEELKDS